MNKKGSHVGMVLSFVIFVTFLFFIYTILSPSVSVEREKQDLLEYLKFNLVKSLSDNVTIATIRLNDGFNPGKTCISLNLGSSFSQFGNPIVKDSSGNMLTSSTTSNPLVIKWVAENGLFLKIYYSNQFTPSILSDTNCKFLAEGIDYEIGSVMTSQYVFVSKVDDFKADYVRDYEEVKKNFNFPNASDFDFSFDLGGGEPIDSIEENVPANVYAEEIPVQYVDNTANIKYGFLKLRVW